MKQILSRFKKILIKKNDRRFVCRDYRNFTIAMNVNSRALKNEIYSGEEIIARLENISKCGACILCPRNWKCLICKMRIELPNNSICSLKECGFRPADLSVGTLLSVSIQMRKKIVEDISSTVVWYKESPKSDMPFDQLGIRFENSIEYM